MMWPLLPRASKTARSARLLASVAPDVKNHAAQILDAVHRFEAGPRSLEKGPELVIRRSVKPTAEAVAELGLAEADHQHFAPAE